MRKYSPRWMDRDRYMELWYYTRRYRKLTEAEQKKINSIAEKITEVDYAGELLKGICEGVPYKSLELPYSEREYSRLRRRFFEELDKVRK